MAEEFSKILSLLSKSQISKGAFPDSSFLKQYEEILPGSADRVITLIEEQIRHRHKPQEKQLKYNHIELILGQIFGFFIGIFAIGAGAYTAIQGHEISGSFIGTAGMVGLVAVFVMGSKSKKSSKSE